MNFDLLEHMSLMTCAIFGDKLTKLQLYFNMSDILLLMGKSFLSKGSL